MRTKTLQTGRKLPLTGTKKPRILSSVFTIPFAQEKRPMHRQYEILRYVFLNADMFPALEEHYAVYSSKTKVLQANHDEPPDVVGFTTKEDARLYAEKMQRENECVHYCYVCYVTTGSTTGVFISGNGLDRSSIYDVAYLALRDDKILAAIAAFELAVIEQSKVSNECGSPL